MAKIGVQLYTVRDACEKDFLGTLEKLAELGFEGVEFAGFYDVSKEKLKEHLIAYKLVPIASHTSMELLEDALEEVITYNKYIGNKRIVCPWAEVKDEEGILELSKKLLAIGKRLKEEEMELLYHNHDHEFQLIGGKVALESLLSRTEGMMTSELDTFWAYRAGYNPIEYMKKLSHKLSLIHLKDGTKDAILSIGSGELPIREIIEQAKVMDIPWLIVENDTPAPNGLEDVARSMTYLKKITGGK